MPEPRIRILEEEVANKIAAGEVVERPASVVKELAENAIDAGATRVTVEVEDGGKGLIRITDNGCGMTAQEAVLALQRHATSKITRAEDLAAVRSLGFRGEALPSIASVSRLTLISRARGEMEGARLEVEAGEIKELETAGAAEGTLIAVRDLFYNTPARLRFLKTTRTELGQICDVVTRLALSRPGVALRLLSEGEEIVYAPGSADPQNTIAALYGKDVARELVAVTYGRPGVAVEGYVSRPTLSRPTRSAVHFFVNGRWVRNRTLAHAVDEAYRSTLPSGRFPFAVLHVEIDPGVVDVNVHPTKAEVRFLRDWEVHRAVLEAVRQAIGAPAGGTHTPLARQHALPQEQLRQGDWLPSGEALGVGRSALGGEAPSAEAEAAVGRVGPPGAGEQQPLLDGLDAPLPGLRLVAQLWNSYLIAEGPSGIVLIDQHLAHERILFEKLRTGPKEERFPSQLLTAPLTLQLTHREALAADELLPELARVGFAVEPFGRDAFVLRAVPTFVRAGTELAALRELLDELIGRRGAAGAEDAHPPAGAAASLKLTDRVVAATACRCAVKKGSPLAPEEMKRLLEELGRTENAATCPHGCPIAVEISFQELLRRFKRV
jgi:DNA mismatch repair protein MutL